MDLETTLQTGVCRMLLTLLYSCKDAWFPSSCCLQMSSQVFLGAGSLPLPTSHSEVLCQGFGTSGFACIVNQPNQNQFVFSDFDQALIKLENIVLEESFLCLSRSLCWVSLSSLGEGALDSFPCWGNGDCFSLVFGPKPLLYRVPSFCMQTGCL